MSELDKMTQRAMMLETSLKEVNSHCQTLHFKNIFINNELIATKKKLEDTKAELKSKTFTHLINKNDAKLVDVKQRLGKNALELSVNNSMIILEEFKSKYQTVMAELKETKEELNNKQLMMDSVVQRYEDIIEETVMTIKSEFKSTVEKLKNKKRAVKTHLLEAQYDIAELESKNRDLTQTNLELITSLKHLTTALMRTTLDNNDNPI